MSGAPPTLGETDLKGTMGIDGRQLMGDSRWTAHEILWNAVVVNVTTHWWFGPLLVSILISAGWKKSPGSAPTFRGRLDTPTAEPEQLSRPREGTVFRQRYRCGSVLLTW